MLHASQGVPAIYGLWPYALMRRAPNKSFSILAPKAIIIDNVTEASLKFFMLVNGLVFSYINGMIS